MKTLNSDRQPQPKESFAHVGPWGPLGLRGISHISVNVPDVDEAVEFYRRVLGFEVMSAGDKWGDFEFRPLEDEAFAKSAGFMDGKCKLDCVWMKHPHIGINLELFRYYEPKVTNRVLQDNRLPNTQDVSGIKHIAFVVEDADKAFAFLKQQPDVKMISEHPEYRPVQMTPLPFKFFYWRDPYGVQWECEEGDKVVTYQIAGLTRLMDEYASVKDPTFEPEHPARKAKASEPGS